MRLKKISLISLGIIFISTSFYISTLIYTSNISGYSHFISDFENINYKIHEFPDYSYLEFPNFTFTTTGENSTILLTNDLKSKINTNIGLLKNNEFLLVAFSKKPMENGLYAIDKVTFYQSQSIKGTSTGLYEITNFVKVDQTFLTNQEIYKVISILFFIIGFSIMSLYILSDNLNSEGFSSLDKGKFDEAIISCTKALEIDPENEEVYINLGRIFLNLREFDKAKKYYDKAIELFPESHTAWAENGWFYYQINDFDNAIKYYKKAIELNPELDWAYFDMACAFSMNKDVDNAVDSLKKAINLSTYYIFRARHDKELDNIRNNPEFISLIRLQ
ncbi:MAG: tetratricopeptide repeat protein [Candidatus Methanoperedens sp.]|nr:tetratricopeptide repeat protein [Candidatus Methanoperedens sp.]